MPQRAQVCLTRWVNDEAGRTGCCPGHEPEQVPEARVEKLSLEPSSAGLLERGMLDKSHDTDRNRDERSCRHAGNSFPTLARLGPQCVVCSARKAVLPGSEASVLVLFGFAGLKEYAELVSLEAGDSLLDWLGGRIAWAIGDEGQLFHTRRCEFFALLNGRLGTFHELLVRIRADLDEVGQPFEVRSFLGFAVLPDEAKLPTLAVVRADERLSAMIGDVRPRTLDGRTRPAGRSRVGSALPCLDTSDALAAAHREQRISCGRPVSGTTIHLKACRAGIGALLVATACAILPLQGRAARPPLSLQSVLTSQHPTAHGYTIRENLFRGSTRVGAGSGACRSAGATGRARPAV